MLLRLLLLFTLLPLVELALLLYVGDRIGLLGTIGLVVGTGLLGAALAKHQGLRVWRRMREDVAVQRLPAEALLDGFLILAAGVLLVTPGLITDALGFSLLLPACRNRVKRRFVSFLRAHAVAQVRTSHQNSSPVSEPTVIDAEFTSTADDDYRENPP